MNTLIDLPSKEIAARYRALFAEQCKASPEKQWQFGAELSALKKAFIVAKEAEQLRST